MISTTGHENLLASTHQKSYSWEPAKKLHLELEFTSHSTTKGDHKDRPYVHRRENSSTACTYCSYERGLMNHDSGQCPICGGSKTAGAITFTADLQETLVVVRGVPATVCALCGNEWLNDETAVVLEQIVEYARKKSFLFEVAQFSAFVPKHGSKPPSRPIMPHHERIQTP